MPVCIEAMVGLRAQAHFAVPFQTPRPRSRPGVAHGAKSSDAAGRIAATLRTMAAHDDDDLDQLVSQLNLTVTTDRRQEFTETGTMSAWLRAVREADGSDLLLVTGVPPTVRATGRLTALTPTLLEPEDVEAAALPFVPRRLETRYREGEAIDLAF